MEQAMNIPRPTELVVAELATMIREVVGEDYLGDLEIGMETSFSEELELESIELVALSERMLERYGDRLQLESWLQNMELEEIIHLEVGDLVRRVVQCIYEPQTA